MTNAFLSEIKVKNLRLPIREDIPVAGSESGAIITKGENLGRLECGSVSGLGWDHVTT